jgi:hypothetical protein
MLEGDEVAVDGSFFKADASKDSIFTAKKLERQLEELDKRIEAYQQQLAEQDTADDKAGVGSWVDDADLADKIVRLKNGKLTKRTCKTS